MSDLETIKNIHKKSWKDNPPQYPNKYGWSEDLDIIINDLTIVFSYFRTHQDELIFEPGSGVFGFGISMTAFTLVYPIYPGLPYEVKHLITLTSKQLKSNCDDPYIEFSNPYELFRKFIYTDRNKELRKIFGFKEKLKSLEYYDY